MDIKRALALVDAIDSAVSEKRLMTAEEMALLPSNTPPTEEKVYFENILYIAVNCDGDVTADMDRDAAVQRMEKEYGGEIVNVLATKVKVERRPDYLASITINHGDTEATIEA